MKCVKAPWLSLIFTASISFTSPTEAGTVTFDPLTETVVQPGETVEFEVSVTPSDSLGSFDSLEMVIGSYDLEMVDFEYHYYWYNDWGGNIPISANLYPSDFFVGGFSSKLFATKTPLGTLTIGVPNGLSAGEYTIFVDGDFDDSELGGDINIISHGSISEPLFGSATVTVVPEPATLVLLGIVGLAVLRRRK